LRGIQIHEVVGPVGDEQNPRFHVCQFKKVPADIREFMTLSAQLTSGCPE
jgi:hypothetical protein